MQYCKSMILQLKKANFSTKITVENPACELLSSSMFTCIAIPNLCSIFPYSWCQLPGSSWNIPPLVGEHSLPACTGQLSPQLHHGGVGLGSQALGCMSSALYTRVHTTLVFLSWNFQLIYSAEYLHFSSYFFMITKQLVLHRIKYLWDGF